MTTIRFHLRPAGGNSQKQWRFFIRVIHKRQYRDILRDLYCEPGDWCQGEQRLIFPAGNISRRNELKEIQRSMREDIQRMEKIIVALQSGGQYTAGDIAERFLSRDSGQTIFTYSRKLESALTSSGRERTARAYRSAVRSLVDFNNGEDVPFSRLDQPLVQSYEEYLLGKGLQMNTVSFYMRNLRAIYYKAVKDGLLATGLQNPFSGVYTGVHQTKRRSLDRDDIRALAKLAKTLESLDGTGEIPHGMALKKRYVDRVNRALLYFMFAYHSRGMSFIDLAFLKKSEVHGNIIRYKRKKTGLYMEVTVTAAMQNIIDRFAAETQDSPYVFPIVTPGGQPERAQYEYALNIQNKLLKTIARNAGIDKNLSTHVARHTWATMAKRLGYAVALISEGLGHQDTKVTSIYLDSFERSAMDELSRKLSDAVSVA